MKRILSFLLTLCIILTLGTITGCAAENTKAADGLSIILQIDNTMMTTKGAEKKSTPAEKPCLLF